MAYVCPQCGAIFSCDEKCEDRFSLILSKEFENPEYGAVHHLSVPCYHLQHNLYSKEGWLITRALVYQFLFNDLTPEMARRDNRSNFNSNNREFRIKRGEKLIGVDDIKWSFTVADVRLDTAEVYCHDVTNWAKSTIKDSEHIKETFNSI
jgi:hypothetical protein